MSAYYDLYETPDVQNTGEKQPLHARDSSERDLFPKRVYRTCVTLSTFSPEYG